MGVAARAVSRGPAQRGCDRPRVLLDADTMLLKVLPKLSEAAAISEQGPQTCLGMRTSAHVVCVQFLQRNERSLSHSLQEAGHGN